MTEAQVHDKVKHLLINGNLVMGRSKMIVPIPESFLNYVEIAKLYVAHNLRRKAITPQQSDGYKNGINKDNCLKILKERLPLNSGGYCTLHDVDQVTRNRQGLDAISISLSMCFKSWMSASSYEFHYFNGKLKEFFMYMPQLSYLTKNYIDNRCHFESAGWGYCCEDCDGPIDYYYQQNYRRCIDDISAQLDRIKEK